MRTKSIGSSNVGVETVIGEPFLNDDTRLGILRTLIVMSSNRFCGSTDHPNRPINRI